MTARISILGLAAALGLAMTLPAQGYTKKVVGQNLKAPTGVAVHPNGNVYFTELPEPGRSGGMNSVSFLDPSNGNVTLVVPGEPGPTNIAITQSGDFYWTCSTAGVMFRRNPMSSSNQLVMRGLSNPTGIAVTDAGTVYFTQVPNPGQAMMGNTVSVINGSMVQDLSTGEPEPVDVTVNQAGDLYWTCRTAGVILKRDAGTGMKTKVFGNLDMPTGIAMDTAGNIFFTEVPTPAVPGTMGGKNAVWKWNPTTSNLSLVSYGEPEPVDVSVARDGSKVFWTCRTAGVIVEGTPVAATADVTTNSPTTPGSVVTLNLMSSGDANLGYQAASAFDKGAIPVDMRYVPLAADALFFATAQNQVFRGYAGRLDATGSAQATLAIPNDSAIVGLDVYTAFVTIDNSAPSGVKTISSAHRLTVQ